MKTDNELIAEFMGLERAKANHDFFFIAEYHAYVSPENILYHKSWDWLMPVVEKINESCKDTGYPDGLEICDWHVIAVANNIKLVYFSVVEFIKWYNENAKSSN